MKRASNGIAEDGSSVFDSAVSVTSTPFAKRGPVRLKAKAITSKHLFAGNVHLERGLTIRRSWCFSKPLERITPFCDGGDP